MSEQKTDERFEKLNSVISKLEGEFVVWNTLVSLDRLSLTKTGEQNPLEPKTETVQQLLEDPRDIDMEWCVEVQEFR